MTPVDQDIFINDPQGRIGNCLQAAVASILDRELNDVPHFCGVPEGCNWYGGMIQWLHNEGYVFLDVRGKSNLFYHTGYVIACGESERGAMHAVVYENGELVHDPHPSKAGILEIDHYYIIAKKL